MTVLESEVGLALLDTVALGVGPVVAQLLLSEEVATSGLDRYLHDRDVGVGYVGRYDDPSLLSRRQGEREVRYLRSFHGTVQYHLFV